MLRLSFVILTLLFSSGQAHGTCSSEKSKADSTKAKAQTVSDAAKANEAAAAKNASAQSGQNINTNANLASGAAATCGAGYGAAANELSGLLKQCEAPCTPKDSSENAICSQCRKAVTECKSTVSSHLGQNTAGQAQCQQAKEGADKTGEESKGQMPQMPQMPSAGEETPEPAIPEVAVDCTKADSHMNPECNQKTLSECEGSSGSEKCETFGFRYCTPESGGGTGEGIGTAECKERLVSHFCKNEKNNVCPSCKQAQLKNSPVCKDPKQPCVEQSKEQQLAEAQKNCPTDPIFVDPSLAQSGTAAGGAAGATSGAVGGSLPPAVPEEKKPVKQGNTYKDIELGTDGGGGGYSASSAGGSSFDSESNPYNYQFGGKKPASASAPIAGETAMLTSEVNGRFTKTLFTMSTEAIQARCVRGMLHRCGPN